MLDLDSCDGRHQLRFKVGDHVLCFAGKDSSPWSPMVAASEWRHAVVVQLWFRDEEFEANKIAAYQVKELGGGYRYAPNDTDDCIRLLDTGGRGPSSCNNNRDFVTSVVHSISGYSSVDELLRGIADSPSEEEFDLVDDLVRFVPESRSAMVQPNSILSLCELLRGEDASIRIKFTVAELIEPLCDGSDDRCSALCKAGAAELLIRLVWEAAHYPCKCCGARASYSSLAALSALAASPVCAVAVIGAGALAMLDALLLKSHRKEEEEGRRECAVRLLAALAAPESAAAITASASALASSEAIPPLVSMLGCAYDGADEMAARLLCSLSKCPAVRGAVKSSGAVPRLLALQKGGGKAARRAAFAALAHLKRKAEADDTKENAVDIAEAERVAREAEKALLLALQEEEKQAEPQRRSARNKAKREKNRQKVGMKKHRKRGSHADVEAGAALDGISEEAGDESDKASTSGDEIPAAPSSKEGIGMQRHEAELAALEAERKAREEAAAAAAAREQETRCRVAELVPSFEPVPSCAATRIHPAGMRVGACCA